MGKNKNAFDEDHDFTGGDDSYCTKCGEPDLRVRCWNNHGSYCSRVRGCSNGPCGGVVDWAETDDIERSELEFDEYEED